MIEEVCLVYQSDEDYFIEKINAIKKGKYYQIQAVPAFARNIAYGDLIKTELENGEIHFEELIKESGHSTLHIMVFDAKVKARLVANLVGLGCGVNTNVADNYLVIDIPPLQSYYSIKNLLDKEELSQSITYTEACISQQHKLSLS